MSALPINIYGEIPETVLNMARSRVNSMTLTPDGYPSGSDPGSQFNELGGGSSLSSNINPDGTLILRTQVIFNAGWKKFQKDLGNLGYRLMIGDGLVIPSIPINASADPAVQTWISWNGTALSDGTGLVLTPALPRDFYAPLKIAERQSGANSAFIPMTCALDGLRPMYIRGILNRYWEWRMNALYMPGATSVTDLQLRYIRRLSEYPDPNYRIPGTPWYLQELPIPGCASALAWYVAYEAVISSGDPNMGTVASQMMTNAIAEMELVFNDQARADSRTNNRRRPRGGGRSGWGSTI